MGSCLTLCLLVSTAGWFSSFSVSVSVSSSFSLTYQEMYVFWEHYLALTRNHPNIHTTSYTAQKGVYTFILKQLWVFFLQNWSKLLQQAASLFLQTQAPPKKSQQGLNLDLIPLWVHLAPLSRFCIFRAQSVWLWIWMSETKCKMSVDLSGECEQCELWILTDDVLIGRSEWPITWRFNSWRFGWWSLHYIYPFGRCLYPLFKWSHLEFSVLSKDKVVGREGELWIEPLTLQLVDNSLFCGHT